MRHSDSQQDESKSNLDNLHSTFIRNVEHELRTPLAIMQGYAELLQKGELGDLAPEQQEAMFVIVNRAYEMRKLVDRLGVLMAIQSQMSVWQQFSLADVVARLMAPRSDAAGKAGLDFEYHIEPDAPLMQGDAEQVRRACECLLENAFKFTPRGGRVHVRVYTEPGWACCTIADTGIGIEPDKLAHLFDGFYQADGSTTRRYGGIGLGLTVAKAVIDSHGGRIEVKSQPGQGSQFTVKFPLLSEAHGEQLPEKSVIVRHILVVDDEESVAVSLQAGLEKLPNCRVATASNGIEALRLLEQQAFDLLVTDYKMPEMDGLTLAARVRQLYPQTSIVMLTAFGDEELRRQAADGSIQYILDKPVKLSGVRNVVTAALDGKKTQGEE